MSLIVDLLLIFVILIISGGLFTSMYFNYKQFQDFTKFKEISKKQDSNLQVLFNKVNENDKYLKDQTDKQQKFIDQNKSQMATLSESIKPILKNDNDSKSDLKSDGSDVKKNIDSNSVKNNVSNKMFKDFGLNTTTDKSDTDKTITSDKTDTDKTTTSDKTDTDKTDTDKTDTDKTITSDKTNTDKTITSDKTDTDKTTTSDKTNTDKTTTSDKTDTDKTKKDTKDSDEAFSPILSKVMNSQEILNNLKNIIYSY